MLFNLIGIMIEKLFYGIQQKNIKLNGKNLMIFSILLRILLLDLRKYIVQLSGTQCEILYYIQLKLFLIELC